MAGADLDALVVRAPDNVLYLSNYWGMKGYDAVVFPRDGEPTLIALAPRRPTPSAPPGRRTSGSSPATTRATPGRRLRALELAREAAGGYERVGLELSLGTQAADRMVGEPTTFTQAWFDWPQPLDATPLLDDARAIKTEQEVERMRLANEIASAAMEYVREHLRPGMKESEAAALWEGFVHGRGTGWEGRSSSPGASRSSGRARASARSRRPATGRCRRTSRRCSRSGSAPTATGATTRRTSAPAR